MEKNVDELKWFHAISTKRESPKNKNNCPVLFRGFESLQKKILRRVKVVLSVEDGEHPLVEVGEEPPEGVLQVDLAVVVVGLEVLEEVDEDV